MNSKFTAFHWPDHNIGKRESRVIRDQHNALYNSHAELLAALENAANVLAGLAMGDLKTIAKDSPALLLARAAIAKARNA